MQSNVILKRVIFLIIIIGFCNSVSAQSTEFWMGQFINSSESENFRVKVDNNLYEIVNKDWVKDIELPAGGFNAIEIDRNSNIWLFEANGIRSWNSKLCSWTTISAPPVDIIFGKVFGDYIYCGNSTEIYRTNYTLPSISWERVYDGSQIEDFYIHDSLIYVAIYDYKVLRSNLNSKNWETILTTETSPAKVVVTDSMICVGTFWNGVLTSTDNGVSWTEGSGLPTQRGCSDIVIKDNCIYALIRDQISSLGWYFSSDSGKTFQSIVKEYSPWTLNQTRGLQYDDSLIYIDAGYRGFFYSNNNGESWNECNNGYDNFKPHHISDIISLEDEIIVLSTIGGMPWPWYLGSWGIFSSSDNGTSWEEISYNLYPDYYILEDIIATSEGDLIVAPYDAGSLYIQRKDSTNWTRINVADSIISGTYDGSTIEILEADSNKTVYAGTFWDGLLKSEDRGNTWTVVDFGISRRGVSYIFTDGDKVFIISNDQSGYVGLFYSPDSGVNWEQLNDGGNDFVGVIESDSTLFAYTDNSVYKSTDFGKKWLEIDDDLPVNISIKNIDFAQDQSKSDTKGDVNGTIYIASDLGAYSRDANSYGWTQRSPEETNCVFFSEKSQLVYYGGIEIFYSQSHTSTSIDDIEINDRKLPFDAYYSAMNDQIVFNNRFDSDVVESISLINLTGQKLVEVRSGSSHNISMSGYKSGIYIIVAKYNSGKQYSRTLVVSR